MLGGGQFAIGELAAQDVYGCARLDALSTGVLHGGDAVAGAHHHGGIGSEKGVARKVLAALDRLQQERTFGTLGDPEVSRERGQQIGRNRFGDGDQTAGRGKAAELGELGAGGHFATTGATCSGLVCASARVRPTTSAMRRRSPTMAAN